MQRVAVSISLRSLYGASKSHCWSINSLFNITRYATLLARLLLVNTAFNQLIHGKPMNAPFCTVWDRNQGVVLNENHSVVENESKSVQYINDASSWEVVLGKTVTVRRVKLRMKDHNVFLSWHGYLPPHTWVPLKSFLTDSPVMSNIILQVSIFITVQPSGSICLVKSHLYTMITLSATPVQTQEQCN